MRFANALEGAAPADFKLTSRLAIAKPGNKGKYGCYVELIFGLDCSNRSEADFPTAAIELKTTKLRRQKTQLVVGERTSIQMIDYVRVGAETWSTASVRKKLAKILFCFYRWDRDSDPRTWPIDTMYLWEPDELQWKYLRDDWHAIQRKISASAADQLSESDTKVLTAATKGANSLRLRPQVGGGKAKLRAFALKQAFVRTLYENARARRVIAESLVENLEIDRLSQFEGVLLERFTPFVGRRVDDVAEEFDVGSRAAKGYTAAVISRVVKKILGVRDTRARIREFDEFGIELKIVPMSHTGSVKEAMSFPAFKYNELLAEEWDTSELRQSLDHLLIVPIWQQRRGDAAPEWLVGAPFFWKPSAEEEQQIRREWEMYRREIAAGRANALPPASKTKVIHVRPHARNRSDTDIAPVVGAVTIKSFWLNSAFVAELVREESPRPS